MSTSFFSNLFNRTAPVVATDSPTPVDAAVPTADSPGPANVLQSLTVPSAEGSVLVAVSLSSSSFDAKDLEERGLTYAQVADLVRTGSSQDIGSYTIVGQNGTPRSVNGNDLFVAEDATVGPVNRVDTTPASSGELG